MRLSPLLRGTAALVLALLAASVCVLVAARPAPSGDGASTAGARVAAQAPGFWAPAHAHDYTAHAQPLWPLESAPALGSAPSPRR